MSVFPVLGGFTHHILFTFTSLLKPSRVSLKCLFQKSTRTCIDELSGCLIMIEVSSLQLVPCILYMLYTTVTELVTDFPADPLPFEHHLVNQSRLPSC